MNAPFQDSLSVNPNWAKLPIFDRSKRSRVRFGDVVENLNETCDPAAVGIERYVGLEHLEPESLQIRNWGDVANGTTFTRRARPGQVLFGKRRAYQRKVAVAHSEFVVSGDIYVFAPRGDRLLPELLPYLCMSEDFFKHAVGTSVGSLSPRTNWSSLAGFEFDLPSIEQQRSLTALFCKAEVLLQRQRGMAVELLKLHGARLDAAFSGTTAWPIRRLEEVARVERGKFSHRPRNLPEFYGGPYPFVQTGDVQRGPRHLRSFEYSLTELGASYSKSFPAGTVLVTIAAVIGATAIADREVFATDSVVAVVPGDEMDVDYLELFLRSRRHYLENQAATQTAQKNINLQILRPLAIPCPPPHKQREIASSVLEPLVAYERILSGISRTRNLVSVVLDAALGQRELH